MSWKNKNRVWNWNLFIIAKIRKLEKVSSCTKVRASRGLPKRVVKSDFRDQLISNKVRYAHMYAVHIFGLFFVYGNQVQAVYVDQPKTNKRRSK